MTWLFPLYLAGAGAVLLPILLHLRRKPPQEQVEFSSLMFLDAAQQVPLRKRRLERWLLLALRCLALLLLALMFARPLVRGWLSPAGGEAGRAVVVLVDHSASMQRQGFWEQAMEWCGKTIQDLPAGARLGVAVFDRSLKPVWTFGEDRDAAATPQSRWGVVSGRLGALKPGWGATYLGSALTGALAWFAEVPPADGDGVLAKEIILISDLQEGAHLEALRGYAWPEDVQVRVLRVEAPNQDNFTLSLAAAIADPGTSRIDARAKTSSAALRVRLSNARDSKTENWRLQWQDGGSGADGVSGFLPAGATRVVLVPPRGDEKKAGVLALTGDRWDFDNRVFVAPSQPRMVGVLYAGGESARNEAGSPFFYLARALQPGPTLDPLVEAAGDVAGLTTKLGRARVLVAPPDWQPGTALAPVQEWIRGGGLLVVITGEGTTAAQLEEWSGSQGISFTPGAVSSGSYAMLGEVDVSHPLLNPFTDPRLRDFTKIRFWRHDRISLDGKAAESLHVIARYDDGAPAWLAAKQGSGYLFVMTSGWHPRDSQLALSTKFVPLLFGWLEALGYSTEDPSRLTVGDDYPVSDLAGEVTIREADGNVFRWTSGGAQPVPVAQTAGVSEIIQKEFKRSVAVNLAPEEGRVTPMEAASLAALGVKLDLSRAAGADGRERRTPALGDAGEDLSAEEQRQSLWFWLLGILLGVIALETWLAGRGSKSEGLSSQPT